MPLYEYKCKKCGHRFELIQSFSAEDAKECPEWARKCAKRRNVFTDFIEKKDLHHAGGNIEKRGENLKYPQ